MPSDLRPTKFSAFCRIISLEQFKCRGLKGPWSQTVRLRCFPCGLDPFLPCQCPLGMCSGRQGACPMSGSTWTSRMPRWGE